MAARTLLGRGSLIYDRAFGGMRMSISEALAVQAARAYLRQQFTVCSGCGGFLAVQMDELVDDACFKIACARCSFQAQARLKDGVRIPATRRWTEAELKTFTDAAAVGETCWCPLDGARVVVQMDHSSERPLTAHCKLCGNHAAM